MHGEDRREYEGLFRASYSSVLRTVSLITRDQARAEEICQDAFVTLYEKWAVVSEYEHPEAWVRKVAVRSAIRTTGRDRRRAVLEFVHQGGARPDPSWPDVDLARALGALPRRQRAAIVLFYLHDLSVGEVARVLGVSESSVKQHLYRARHRLAEALGEEVDVRVD